MQESEIGTLIVDSAGGVALTNSAKTLAGAHLRQWALGTHAPTQPTLLEWRHAEALFGPGTLKHRRR